MKKRYIIPAAVVAILLLGAILGLNAIFPKAEPINADTLKRAELCYAGEKETRDIPKEHLPQLRQYLSNAKPTREISMNDTPGTADYYSIELYFGELSQRAYVYKRGTAAYLELPYDGIYISEEGFFELAKALCKR